MIVDMEQRGFNFLSRGVIENPALVQTCDRCTHLFLLPREGLTLALAMLVRIQTHTLQHLHLLVRLLFQHVVAELNRAVYWHLSASIFFRGQDMTSPRDLDTSQMISACRTAAAFAVLESLLR